MFRSFSSVIDTRLRGTAALISHLLLWVPAGGGIALILWTRHGGPLWAMIPGLALIALGFWVGGRYFKKAWLEQNRRDNGQADALLESDATIVLRRRLEFGWPLVFTLIAVAFAVFSLVDDVWPVMVLTTLPLLVVASIWWFIAARRTRPFGVVSARDLRLGDESLPWDRVGVSAESIAGSRGRRELVVTLAGDPRERRIPLSELDGTPAVIHQVIEGHVQREKDKRARAEMEREMRAMRERLSAHPEDETAVLREFQQQFERDMRETGARIAQFDARMSELKSRSIWRAPPGAMPMKKQWMIVGFVFVWIAFTVFGLFAAFYKSEDWARISLYATLGVTLALSIWIWKVMLPRLPRGSRIGVALLTPFFVGVTMWLPIANALPALYTRIAGKPFAIDQEMRLASVRDKNCPQRVYAPLFERGNPSSFYCASSGEYGALVGGKALRIRGRETWFGRHVDGVEPQ